MKRVITFLLSFMFLITGVIGNTALALESNVLKDGKYSIENNALHIDKDEESIARKYLEKQSNIFVENGKIYLTVKFTGKSMMKNHEIKVNNESVKFEILEETDKTIEIKFPINSLKDSIVVSAKIVLPFMTKDVNFRLVLKEDTLKAEEIKNPGLDLKEGTYFIQNDALHISQDKESTARKYLEKTSKILVEKGEMYLTLKFTGKNFMKDYSIKINDQVVEFEKLEETDNTVEIKFPINSLKENIIVSAKIVLPFMTKNVDFRLVLKEDTLTEDEIIEPEQKPDVKPEEKPEGTPDNGGSNGNGDNVIPDVDDAPIIDPETIKPTVNGLEYGIYSITNNVISDSPIGYDAARSALNPTSRVEVKDGYIYLTLGFGSTNLMSNIRVYMNGGRVNYEVTHSNSSNNTMDIKFRIPSLNTKLTIKAYIGMIERDIQFGVTLNESSLVKLEGASAVGQVSTPATINPELNSEESKEEENEEESVEDAQELEVKEYLKKYTIKNGVVHDSAIGRKMSRKYLAETSILEEVDGQYYLTLEFSGTNVMENFRIHVNGEEVDYSVVKHDTQNNIKAFRFKINSLDDEIRVYCLVNIMKMNIDFGVTLDKDSMTLVDDITIEKMEKEKAEEMAKEKPSKLPIIISGGAGIIIGIVISSIFGKIKNRKKSNKDKE